MMSRKLTLPAFASWCWLVCAAMPLGAQDPWKSVPALPTSCYTNDRFQATVEAAAAALTEDIRKQEAINRALQDQVSRLDGATRQSRMMAYMQKNQAEYMKRMGGAQAAAARQGGAGAIETKKTAFDERLKKLEEQYTAEFRRLLPAGDPPADLAKFQAQRVATLARINAEYPALCEHWFTRGPFVDYLRDYKRFLAEEVIPLEDENADGEKWQIEQFGVPVTTFKSTAGMKAVAKYLAVVNRVFAKREAEKR